ncbi:hypothetical protein KEM52_002774 [Ascosphaera acerosa]|nr:hypothetical protein KEM52_002774 [Ascosphaera acerosa]
MVYYKRRPVQFVDIPEGLKATDEVWVIPETREIFRSYDVFEERMNFYRKAQFVCEGTGHSALTFFEALESERQFSEEVNKIFPEALKEPVLRRVQFAVTARLDHLVDQVYDELKADFYPGERVTVCLANGSRLHGVVREKARFPQVLDKDGNVARRASSKYLVQLLAPRENEEALVADEHLVRDRKIFTKAMLRGFIRNSVQRENWNGAPWLVKEGLAHEYNISTQVAKHLQRNKKKGHSKTSAPVATDAAGPTAPVATRTLKSKATPSTAAADASSESRTADEAMMSPSSGTRTDPGIGTTMAATPLDTSEEVSRTTTPRGGYLKDGTQASGGMFGLFASGSVGVGPRGGIRAGVKRKNRSPTREDISRDTKQSFLAYQRALDGRPEFIVDYHQAHMANAGSDPNSCNSATDSAKAVPVANGRRGSQATTVTSAALAALTASPQEVSVRPSTVWSNPSSASRVHCSRMVFLAQALRATGAAKPLLSSPRLKSQLSSTLLRTWKSHCLARVVVDRLSSSC